MPSQRQPGKGRGHGDVGDVCITRRSLPTPGPPSSCHESDDQTSGYWTSGTCSMTSQRSCCSSDSFGSFKYLLLKGSEPTSSQSRSLLHLPHDSVLFDLICLQQSTEDMTRSHGSLALSLRTDDWESDEDDLSLTPPESPLLLPAKPASAIGWATAPRVADGGDIAKQPWRRFWPPIVGGPLFTHVVSQRPEVLSFSFDPRNHLFHQHHPWQAWKEEHPPIGGFDEEDLPMDEFQLCSLGSALGPETYVDPVDRKIRDDLDDLIEVDLQLPCVAPKEFNYLSPLARYHFERPYRLQLPPGLVPMNITNVVAKSYPVHVYDLSGHEQEFALDQSGFQFFKCPVAVGEWNDKAVTETYLPALLDWVVPLLGGGSGLVYSFNFRHHSSDRFVPVQRPWGASHCVLSSESAYSSDEDDDESYSIKRFLAGNKREDHFNAIGAVEADPSGPCHWKRPLFRVHCDASENTHKHRLPLLRPNDADELMKGRIRLVSVWRKLSEHLQDTPLALCDARTVDRQDLVPMDVVYPHLADEVYEVRHNKNHRWFYNRSMKTNDVAIFKLHDSHSKAKVCPHSAFVDPSIPSNTPPRLSIEVKIMIFGGDESVT
ncbi:hypothetical protein OQA88_8446 [Cercophora sp. LCS_1]